MHLAWKPVAPGVIRATGHKARYAVKNGHSSWWLTIIGHDEIHITPFPRGTPFESQQHARDYAQRVDNYPGRIESEISGT